MAFLRIATFEIADAPEDALEVWDDLMGSALRNDPDCTTVLVSRHGSTYAVVTTWTSEGAFKSTVDSKPYQDILVTVGARLGLPDPYEPSFAYEGEIARQ